MKTRTITLAVYILMLMGAAYQFLSATTMQLWLSGALVVTLVGILSLDKENRFLKDKTNSVLFCLFAALAFVVINAPTKERFFLAVAGTSLVINIFSERQSQPWSGRVFGQAPLLSTLAFFVLVTVSSMPRLTSQMVLVLDLLAIFVLCVQELLCLQRQNAADVAFSPESIFRTLLCGFTSYIYGHSFLPQVATQERIFYSMATALAAVALLLAIVSLFEKQFEKKQIYFSSTWLLLLFWGAVIKADQGYLDVFGTVFAAWVLAASHGVAKEFYTKVFSFACPGSLLFIPLVGILWPIKNEPADLFLWMLAFVVFWVGLTRVENNGKYFISVRQGSLAILTMIISVVLLIGIKLDIIWERF